MKFFFLFIAISAILCAFTACESPKQEPCSVSVYLDHVGHDSTFLLPYHRPTIYAIKNLLGDTGSICVNTLDDFIANGISVVTSFPMNSNCNKTGEIEKYFSVITSKNALVKIKIPMDSIEQIASLEFKISNSPYIDPDHASLGNQGQFIDFFQKISNTYGVFEPSFMSYFSRLPSARNDYSQNTKFYASKTIAGKVFENVFSNQTPIEISNIKTIFFKPKLGVVGAIDKNGVEWALRD